MVKTCFGSFVYWINFFCFPSEGYGNFNIRARIRTAGLEDDIVYCDFNQDGNIKVNDVIAMLIFLRENPGNLKADYNRDGYANIIDAVDMLLAQIRGTCPDP